MHQYQYESKTAPGLATYLNARDISIDEFALEIGIMSITLRNIINDRGTERLQKRIIDKLLTYCGMTYEEMFETLLPISVPQFVPRCSGRYPWPDRKEGENGVESQVGDTPGEDRES